MSDWRLFLYDGHAAEADGTAVQLGEIMQAKDRKLNQQVRQMATASFTVDRDHPLQSVMAGDGTAGPHTRLLVIRDGRASASPSDPPMFVGPLVSYEENDDRIAVTAADGFWRLSKRRVGLWMADVYKSATDGPAMRGTDLFGLTAPTLVAKSYLMRLVIHNVNEYHIPNTGETYTNLGLGTLPGSFCGVAPPLVTSTGLTGEGVGVVGPYVHKAASEAIQEIGANLDAPEWMIDPEEMPRLYDPSGVDAPDLLFAIDPDVTMRLGRLIVAMPGFGGTVRDNARFELGYGRRNVTDFRRLVAADGVMNWGECLPSDGTQVITTADYTDTPTYPVVYQDQVSSDLVVAAMRDQLIQEHVSIRKVARQVITFDPMQNLAANTPVLGVDYQLGDIVPFRAVRSGRTIINAYFRVYGANRALSDDGDETAAPILIPT